MFVFGPVLVLVLVLVLVRGLRFLAHGLSLGLWTLAAAGTQAGKNAHSKNEG